MKHKGYVWIVEQIDKDGTTWPLWGEGECVGNTREQVRRGLKRLRKRGCSKLQAVKYYRDTEVF